MSQYYCGDCGQAIVRVYRRCNPCTDRRMANTGTARVSRRRKWGIWNHGNELNPPQWLLVLNYEGTSLFLVFDAPGPAHAALNFIITSGRNHPANRFEVAEFSNAGQPIFEVAE